MRNWIENNWELLLWMTGASAVLCVVSVVAAGVVLVRLPADYFTPAACRRRESAGKGANGMAWRVAKNALGWPLIVAGAVMLVLPGQGMLVLLMGVMLADFPGKRRLERWLISRKSVLRAINAVRRSFKRPPLEKPRGTDDGRGIAAAPA